MRGELGGLARHGWRFSVSSSGTNVGERKDEQWHVHVWPLVSRSAPGAKRQKPTEYRRLDTSVSGGSAPRSVTSRALME